MKWLLLPNQKQAEKQKRYETKQSLTQRQADQTNWGQNGTLTIRECYCLICFKSLASSEIALSLSNISGQLAIIIYLPKVNDYPSPPVANVIVLDYVRVATKKYAM